MVLFNVTNFSNLEWSILKKNKNKYTRIKKGKGIRNAREEDITGGWGIRWTRFERKKKRREICRRREGNHHSIKIGIFLDLWKGYIHLCNLWHIPSITPLYILYIISPYYCCMDSITSGSSSNNLAQNFCRNSQKQLWRPCWDSFDLFNAANTIILCQPCMIRNICSYRHSVPVNMNKFLSTYSACSDTLWTCESNGKQTCDELAFSSCFLFSGSEWFW